MRAYGLVATLALSACMSMQYQPPLQRAVETTATYASADFDAVWEAVIEMMAKLRQPITTMEKASGLLVTDWISFSTGNAYMDCGRPGAFHYFRQPLGKFNIFVRHGHPVTVSVNTSYRTHLCNEDSCTEVRCVSTGVLEREMHDVVRVYIPHR